MATYQNKGIMSGAKMRSTILNAGDTNTVTSAHTFKATTTMGALSIDQAAHNSPETNGAGKLSVIKDDGEIEFDGQIITVSRTGGSAWNSLSMRGAAHTSSVVELVDGADKHLGQVNSHGTRIGFCGVSAHTASVLSGGLGVARNETFFLQVGSGAAVTNVLDVSIADGEVYFYQGLRATDGSTSALKVDNSSALFDNFDPAFVTATPLGQIGGQALNSASSAIEFGRVSIHATQTFTSAEKGSVKIGVVGTGSAIATGLEVKSNISLGAPVVRISDAWDLPYEAGLAGRVIMSDGIGGTTWGTLSETDTLDSVTDRGATTTNAITTGLITVVDGVNPLLNNSYPLGSSSLAWADIYLGSGANIYFNNNDTILSHVTGEGLRLDISSEANGEPMFTLMGNISANSIGPTMRLKTGGTVSSSEVVGRVDFEGDNSSSTGVTYARLNGVGLVNTAGAHYGGVTLQVASNGTLIDALTTDLGGAMTVKTFTSSGTNGDITLAPAAAGNAVRLTASASTSTQYSWLAASGATNSAAVMTLSEGTGVFGTGTYKGARLAYAGSSTWASTLGTVNAERLTLQIGDNTNGIENVLQVGDTNRTDIVMYGDLIISDINASNNPQLIFRNDKGGTDLTIYSNDEASTAVIDCDLAGLTINTADSAGATMTVQSRTIALKASTKVWTDERIEVGGGSDGLPTSWGTLTSSRSVAIQQISTNGTSIGGRRSGLWLIAGDTSNAQNDGSVDDYDYGWVIGANDNDSTDNVAQKLAFRRSTNAAASSSEIGYLDSAAAAGVIDFTGQHRSVKSASAPAGIESMFGYIVVADGSYQNTDGSIRASINESLPMVTLSTQANQKSVYGVISDAEDANSTERHYSTGAFVSVFGKADTRLIINALGEGGVWVSNINGNIENGDYITTTEIPGLGGKQADDLMHSYTVAKATQDCDFTLDSPNFECVEFEFNGIVYRRAFIGCTYHCG